MTTWNTNTPTDDDRRCDRCGAGIDRGRYCEDCAAVLLRRRARR